MSNAFDPYGEWLGIPKQGFHPDRYRLLGLRPFEEDPAAIAAAAQSQARRVQPQLQGGQAAVARKLLEEVEIARACLLDPGKKRTYDAMLRQQFASRPAPLAAPQAPTQLTATSSPMASDDDVDDLLPPEATLPTQAVPSATAAPSPVMYAAPAIPLPSAPLAVAYPQAVPAPAMPQYPQAMPVAAYPIYPTPPQAAPLAPQAIPVQPYGMGGMNPGALPGGYAAQVAAPAVAMAMPMAGYPSPGAVPALAEAAPFDLAARGSSAALRQARNRRNLSRIMVSVGVVACAVAVLGVGAWLAKEQGLWGGTVGDGPVAVRTQNQRPRRVATPYRSPRVDDVVVSPMAPVDRPAEPDAPAEQPDPPADMPAEMPEEKPAEPEPDPEPTSEPTPEPATPEPEPVPKVDPVLALAGARYALANRDLKRAGQLLAAAQESATPEQAEEVARVSAVLSYVESFWNAVNESLKTLPATSEFMYDGEPAVVVDNAEGALTIRAAGKNQEFTLDKLPTKLAVAIAEHWLTKEDTANKIVVGAFLAVSPKGDREQARGMWLQAGLLGLQEEVDLILPELDVKYPEEPVGIAMSSEATPADGRAAVPAAEAQEAARAEVRQLYNDDYTAAATPPDKGLLADKLLTEAIGTADDLMKRFALLVEARDLGVEAGDAGVVVRAVDVLAQMYAVNALEMKAEMLAAVGKAASGAEANAILARAALDQADEAILEEQIAAAKSLVRTALAAARKSKDGELIKEASQRNNEVKTLKVE